MFAIRAVQEPEDVPRLAGGHPAEAKIDSFAWLQPGNICLTAKSDTGETVGALLLVPDKWKLSRAVSMRVVWLYVEEPYRRHGIARSLLKAAAQKAAQDGIRCLHVAIRPGNAAVIALFDSLSFTEGANYVIDLSHGGL
ncbi:MAG TPA: GNAT family N-acetyltransferase [Symbiobacteriaceae bacterium]|nr:GNAT family N-acetyltransferase [Symbiobacteriaceae bacterium]